MNKIHRKNSVFFCAPLKKLLWSIISKSPPLVFAESREGRWDHEAHNIWSFPGFSKPANHFHTLNQYQVSPGAGKGNLMAFLISCRHWFSHISAERCSRDWRSIQRHSDHETLLAGPGDLKADIWPDFTSISQFSPASSSHAKYL